MCKKPISYSRSAVRLMRAMPCLLVSAVLWSPVQASVSAAYGEEFVRQGLHWRDAGPARLNVAETAAPQSTAPVDASKFEAQLLAYEKSGGPYADSLAEPLAALGQYYRQRGDYEQARLLYSRAVHVVRINDGLYSERQIPLLRNLLINLREAGDLQSLDDRYDYYFRLYGGGRGPFDALTMGASLEYLRWQREAVRIGLDGSDERRLLDLIELNQNILEAVSGAESGTAKYAWQRDLTLSQLQNYYLLRHRLEPLIQQLDAQKSMQIYAAINPGPVDQHVLKLGALYRNAPAAGRRAIQALLPLAEQQGYAELAALQLALADWQFWNGERGAQNSYRRVVQTLMEEGDIQLLDAWLGQPVELPDNGVFWQPPESAALPPPLVRVRFDVTRNGRARNIEPLAGPESSSTAGYLKRRLAGVRFRPRWDSGEPQETLQLERAYEVLN